MAVPGSLEEAREMYAVYIEAEKACAQNQEYWIRDRKFLMADLPAIREGARYWLGRINTLSQNSGGGIAVTRFVPLDD